MLPSSPATTTMSITPISIPPFSPSISHKNPQFHNTIFINFHNYHNHHVKTISFTKIPFKSHPPYLPTCSSFTNSSPIEDEEAELLEGISEILLEAGVSKEESLEIASKSRKYGKMLRDGVKDLDELSLWSSWMREHKNGEGGEMTDLPLLSLKEKVKCIAREKGDNGKIPYLESVGLSLSSAVHLSRILSNHSLSSLIQKVKYVKEIFFSSNDEKLVGKFARRMMLHLSISVDEDVQQTLSFFEKIDARRGGLDMLGCYDASFRYLIESFPRLLLLSVDNHMKPLVNFLESVEVPKDRMGNVLLLYPPLLFLDIKEVIKARSWTLEKTGALDKDFGKMLVKYPWIHSAGVQKNYEEIAALLETKKVPKDSIDRAIINWPLLLGSSADKLKPMVEELDELVVRTNKLGKVIATSPQLLLRRKEEFWTMLTFLQDMGFDTGSIGKILARCPEIFTVRDVTTLHKKLEFLGGLGIFKEQYCRVIKKYPEFFMSDTDNTVMPRLRYLLKWGLSERTIASMVVRFSPLLGYSIKEVLKPKLEFLVNTMGKSIKEVAYYPRYFSYSLEKKIKPRYLVLRGRNVDCSLEEMLSKNDEEFASDFLGIEKVSVSIR
ncbi:uncharacterized protein LOC141622608 [Silene latifolia]|uniref:uncharacterized protein LOC141622608 n=1 Tax=Silene latifolia TaxID=37657 RepID=UPI003D76E95B